MLNANRYLVGDADAVYAESARPAPVRASHYLRVLLRHKLLIAATTILAASFAVLYLVAAPAAYTASSKIVIKNSELRVYQDQIFLAEPAGYSSLIDTQVEIIKSDKLALQVIHTLHLGDDPTFVPSAGKSATHDMFDATALKSAARSVMAFLHLSVPARKVAPPPADLVALARFRTQLKVSTIGTSAALAVSFTARDPGRAADVVNTLVQLYLQGLQRANDEAAQLASGWLRQRLRRLGVNAEVITPAVAPAGPSAPNRVRILAVMLFAGLLLGGGLAFAREAADHTVRTPAQAAELTAAECFGLLPKVRPRRPRRRPPPRGEDAGTPRTIAADAALLAWAVSHPGSRFALTLRAVRTALAARQQRSLPQSVGVTSVQSGEGKSTVAANVARLMAMAGARVLLIDADAAGGTLSTVLSPGRAGGLAEVAADEAALAEHLWHDGATPMHFLPVAGLATPALPEALWPIALPRLLKRIEADYDVVVFDLPPLGPAPDVRAAAEVIDHFLLVVEWGQTSADRIQQALAAAGRMSERLIGTVLNKVDVAAFNRLTGAAGGHETRDHVARQVQSWPPQPAVPAPREDIAAWTPSEERV